MVLCVGKFPEVVAFDESSMTAFAEELVIVNEGSVFDGEVAMVRSGTDEVSGDEVALMVVIVPSCVWVEDVTETLLVVRIDAVIIDVVTLAGVFASSSSAGAELGPSVEVCPDADDDNEDATDGVVVTYDAICDDVPSDVVVVAFRKVVDELLVVVKSEDSVVRLEAVEDDDNDDVTDDVVVTYDDVWDEFPSDVIVVVSGKVVDELRIVVNIEDSVVKFEPVA
ncbi:hypothetical protein MTO96_017538 [Rhipicephalus appendiculatus]